MSAINQLIQASKDSRRKANRMRLLSSCMWRVNISTVDAHHVIPLSRVARSPSSTPLSTIRFPYRCDSLPSTHLLLRTSCTRNSIVTREISLETQQVGQNHLRMLMRLTESKKRRSLWPRHISFRMSDCFSWKYPWPIEVFERDIVYSQAFCREYFSERAIRSSWMYVVLAFTPVHECTGRTLCWKTHKPTYGPEPLQLSKTMPNSFSHPKRPEEKCWREEKGSEHSVESRYFHVVGSCCRTLRAWNIASCHERASKPSMPP